MTAATHDSARLRALIAAGAIGVDAWCVARADRREIQAPPTGERSP